MHNDIKNNSIIFYIFYYYILLIAKVFDIGGKTCKINSVFNVCYEIDNLKFYKDKII